MSGPGSPGRLSLSLACWDYDRTRAIADGRVRPDGIDLTYLPLPVEETFFRAVTYAEFDVAEFSLSSFVVSLDHPEPRYVAIPVFPSRAFRHSGIYVREDDPVERPAELAGRRVGLAEYQLTALVWIRGILAEHHDLPVASVTYVRGGLEQAGREEKISLQLPEEIRIETAPQGRTLSEMLVDGEVDAIYSPRAPSSLGRGVRRLFPDFQTIERRYFERTRIFPIMHLVAIKRSVYARNPWVARNLMKAFDAALARTQEELHEIAALKYTLPWVVAHAEETERLMGPSPWSYGVEANRAVLETFLRYSHEQGLAREQRTPESLFVPESLREFAI